MPPDSRLLAWKWWRWTRLLLIGVIALNLFLLGFIRREYLSQPVLGLGAFVTGALAVIGVWSGKGLSAAHLGGALLTNVSSPRWLLRYPRLQLWFGAFALGLALGVFRIGYFAMTQTRLACADADRVTWRELGTWHLEAACPVKGILWLWVPATPPALQCHYADGAVAAASRRGDHVSCPSPDERRSASEAHACPPDMRLVRGGSFMMGSAPEQRVGESCLRDGGESEVCLEQERRQLDRHMRTEVSAFCMDIVETSNREFARWARGKVLASERARCGPRDVVFAVSAGHRIAILRSDGLVLDPYSGVLLAPREELLEQPAVGITWAAAQEYCEARGGRLPSEAEWEFAARGSQSRAHVGAGPPACGEAVFGRPPPGADGLPSGLCGGPWHEPAAVSLGIDEAWSGVRHLSGNASEWTATAAEPRRDKPGSHYVVKGGSWQDSLFWTRPATVTYYEGGCPSPVIGFRCARGVDG